MWIREAVARAGRLCRERVQAGVRAQRLANFLYVVLCIGEERDGHREGGDRDGEEEDGNQEA
jgi:hypothetical protein